MPARSGNRPVKRLRLDPSKPFAWNVKKRLAARRLAEGELPDGKIAAEAEVTPGTLSGWKRHPDFMAMVEAYIQEIGSLADRHEIGRRAARVARLNRSWRDMQQVIKDRAAAAKAAEEAAARLTVLGGDLPGAPYPPEFVGPLPADGYYATPEGVTAAGARTGLLVRTEKVIGSGANARIVQEYAVDTALLKELRETEIQAAKELGQWSERQEVEVTLPAVRQVVVRSREEAKALLARLEGGALPALPPPEEELRRAPKSLERLVQENTQ